MFLKRDRYSYIIVEEKNYSVECNGSVSIGSLSISLISNNFTAVNRTCNSNLWIIEHNYILA